MAHYTQQERLEIVLDIVSQLKGYTNAQGIVVDLYNDSYSFVPKFKKICNEYIKIEVEHKGKLDFLEIGKTIKYYLPLSTKQKSYFVIKMNER
jgi:septum formation topological specificity factor MinE